MLKTADVVYGCDRAFWHEHIARARGNCRRAELWTCNAEAARIYGLHHVSSEKGGGMSTRRGMIREGGNSGHQALCLALMFLGASIGKPADGRVYLLGFDMKFAANGRKHWHADHGGQLGNPVPAYLRKWVTHFAEIGQQSPVPILNLTRDTALTLPRGEISALDA